MTRGSPLTFLGEDVRALSHVLFHASLADGPPLDGRSLSVLDVLEQALGLVLHVEGHGLGGADHREREGGRHHGPRSGEACARHSRNSYPSAEHRLARCSLASSTFYLRRSSVGVVARRVALATDADAVATF